MTDDRFTISVWFKTSGGGSIFGQYYGPNGHTNHYLRITGDLSFDEYGPSGGVIRSPTNVIDGRWHHGVVDRTQYAGGNGTL